jgi:hypothetical protein
VLGCCGWVGGGGCWGGGVPRRVGGAAHDRLVELMDEVIQNTDALQKLSKEAGPAVAEGEKDSVSKEK